MPDLPGCGFNVDTATGELASLWYDSLGNIAYNDTTGNGPQAGRGLTNTGPFTNRQPYVYWSGTQYAPGPNDAWFFRTDVGEQHNEVKGGQSYGWAVRPGQVAAAPLPATGWLVALGLMVLGANRPGRQATLAPDGGLRRLHRARRYPGRTAHR